MSTGVPLPTAAWSPSASSSSDSVDQPQRPAAVQRSSTGGSSRSSLDGKNPVDVMSRSFAPISGKVDLDEMLSRPPHPHSLKHWVKNARPVEPKFEDKESKSKELEAAKRQLLEASKALARR